MPPNLSFLEVIEHIHGRWVPRVQREVVLAEHPPAKLSILLIQRFIVVGVPGGEEPVLCYLVVFKDEEPLVDVEEGEIGEGCVEGDGMAIPVRVIANTED